MLVQVQPLPLFEYHYSVDQCKLRTYISTSYLVVGIMSELCTKIYYGTFMSEKISGKSTGRGDYFAQSDFCS